MTKIIIYINWEAVLITLISYKVKPKVYIVTFGK